MQTKLIGHHGFDNKCETIRLLKWIDKIKPDIIHLHNIHNHYLNIELLLNYIKQHRIPSVLTLHDCWTFTGHCAYFDYSGCNQWITGCEHCPSLHDYPVTYAPIDPSAWNYCHKKSLFSDLNITLVSPSQWLAGLAMQSFLRDKLCIVINNGVDVECFRPCGNEIKYQLGIENKMMILAMAAGFTKRKGIDFLLQIPTNLTDDEVLVLVGVTPEQKKLLPKRHCIAIERTNDIHELAKYYSAADIFINPTLEDNFPTTNIESLACGTPVITFDTGGSVESVLNEENIIRTRNLKETQVGIVVPKGDINNLMTAIRKICRQEKSVYQLNCRRKAEKCYNKNIQYQLYLDLYRKLICSKEM